MELAGFYFSPDRRIRALQVLDQLSPLHIREPQRLKFLLAPVLVRNASEQEKFYKIFDQFWLEITSTPSDLPPVDSPAEDVLTNLLGKDYPIINKFPLWLRKAIVLLPFIFFVLGLIYVLRPGPGAPEPTVYFETKRDIKAGDSVHVILFTEHLNTSECQFFWTYLDSFPGQPAQAIFKENHKESWSFIMDQAGQKEGQKFLKLLVVDPTHNRRYLQYQPIHLTCKRLPQQDGPLGPPNGIANEPIYFTATPYNDSTDQFQWDFGDGESSTEQNPIHYYRENGVFTVRLKMENTSDAFPCVSFAEQQISIGPSIASIPFRNLSYDEVKPYAQFSQLYWLLVSLVGLYALTWLSRWLQRPYPPDPGLSRKSALAAKYATVDQGPYFIPFRPQKDHIVVSNELFRLAAVLRRRELGLGKMIDVQETVKTTIEEGGFPNIMFTNRTQPSEYLILIDEKTPQSLQSSLFNYLTQLLGEQDVLLKVFRYHDQFNWFWDKEHPKGISADHLYRMHPQHRLIVLGTAHELIDPFSPGQPRLKPKEARFIQQWSHRLLFTPLPQASWTYREKVLYRLFYCFTADTAGLASASTFLENLAWEEDQPPRYERWVQQLNFHAHPDTNFLRWRRLRDHQKYLAQYPDIQNWLYALAVFPKPCWETTIAIGKAIGAPVTYDNLLILSRIPWLQKGELNPRLQREFLAQLSPDIETKARQAVLTELTAVQRISEHSHVNLAVQCGIAIQEFALEPNQETRQDELRFLLAEKLLNKKQIQELNDQLERQVKTVNRPQTKMSKSLEVPSAPTIQEYLKSDEPEAKATKAKRPLVTSSLYHTAWTGLLFFFTLLGSLAVNRSDQLYRWAFKETPTASVEHADRELKSYLGLVLENRDAKENALLNNEAVSAFETMTAFLYQNNVQLQPDQAATLKGSQVRLSRRKLQEALSLDPDYELARSNLNKLDYFLGYEAYQDFLNHRDTSQAIGDLVQFIYPFQRTFADPSLELDYLHAAGLLYYYSNLRDSAQVLLDRLENSSDRVYLDTLSQFPNLRSLLYARKHIITGVVTGAGNNNNGPLPAVTVTVIDPQLLEAGYTLTTLTDQNGAFSIRMPPGYSARQTLLRYTARRFQQEEQVVPLSLDSAYTRTQIRLQPEVVVDTGSDRPASTDPLAVENQEVDGKAIPRRFSMRGGNLPAPQYLWCLDPGYTRQSLNLRSPKLSDGRQLVIYEFTWDIARRIKAGLEKHERESWFIMKDENDIDKPAYRLERIQEFDDKLPKVLLTISVNAGQTTSQNPWNNDQAGIETKYGAKSATSQSIAEFFQSSLVRATGWPDRDIQPSRSARLYLLDRLQLPAIQTESGFYTNEEELRALFREDVRQRIADAHVAAILEIELNMPTTTLGAPGNTTTNDIYPKGSFVDERDQQRYSTVVIDKLEWMAEDLRYASSDSYCFDHQTNNRSDCVRYYSFRAAENSCPKGWRLPSVRDWTQLINALAAKTQDLGMDFQASDIAGYEALKPGGFSLLNLGLNGFISANPKRQPGVSQNQGRTGHYWSSSRITNSDQLLREIKGDPIYNLFLDGQYERVSEEMGTGEATWMPCRCVRIPYEQTF